ncbi:MAG: LPP20 family lipoprotein [Thermonemataceae bacterium]|nr:LPP20 family lipoprotein [Thermonemataceae bacterium]
MKKNIYIIRFLLISLIALVMACSPQTVQSQRKKKKGKTEEVKPKPEWVLAKPISSSYYIGIGFSSNKIPNYQQAAKSNALEDLLSEIKVNISSTSVLYQMDKKNSFKDEYESVVRNTIKNEIEDFEIVDSYENAQEAGYWVYYRLSKSKYAEQKRKKLENATAIALDFFQKAEEAEKQAQVVTAIDFYTKTILALKDYWTETVSTQKDGKIVMLSNESYTRIQQLLDNIKFATPSANVQLKKQTSQAPVVNFKLSYLKTPQANMPILAKYIRNKQSYSTTENGELSILLDKIAGVRNSFTLDVSLELNKIIVGNTEDKFLKFLLSSFRAPAQTITIYLAKPTLYLIAEEKNLGDTQKSKILANQLKGTLANKGYVFVSSKEKAEVILELDADTRKGVENNGIFFAYLTANVKAIDAKTEQEIFNESISDVKGAQSSFQRAGINAYQKATKEVEEAIVQKLIEVL